LELLALPGEIFHEPEQPRPQQSARFQTFALSEQFSPAPAIGPVRNIQPFEDNFSPGKRPPTANIKQKR